MSLLTWLSGKKTRSDAKSKDDVIEELTVQHEEETRSKAAADETRSKAVADETSVATTSQHEERKVKKGVKRKFSERWLQEFSWCDYVDGKLFCTVCVAASTKSAVQNRLGKRLINNAFVTGSTNFQRSALQRHQQCDDHSLSKTVLEQRAARNVVEQKIEKETTSSTLAQLRTAIVLATEDIPDTKFVPLLSLQKANGVESLQCEDTWYKGHDAVGQMQSSAAEICVDRMKRRLQGSPYIGIMLDESLDIAVQKKLVVYFKLLVDGVPTVQFGTNLEVQNGKSATIVGVVRSYLNEMGIAFDRLAGIGTDGANVMVGSKNGVTTVLRRFNPQLISVWCCAHRLSLVAHWAAKDVAALQKVQDVLVALYRYFKYSATRYNKLKEMKAVMKEKVKRFRKPTAVRWLSLQEAVSVVKESWGCLVLSLEDQATCNDGESSTVALSLLKDIKTYKFIATLCLLLDVLEPITKCSKSFQKDVLNIEDCCGMLKATLEAVSTLPEYPGTHLTELHAALEEESYQGINFKASTHQKDQTTALCNTFVQNIQNETNRRFPEGDMETLKRLNRVLNPRLLPALREELLVYGVEDVMQLTVTFPQLNAEQTKADYRLFKFLLNNNRNLSLEEMCTKVIQQHKEQFPGFATLAEICLVVPITSVPCERAFSLQNSVMSAKRNRMSVQTLNRKMQIISESRSADFNADHLNQAATTHFTSAVKRRKPTE